MTRMVYPVLAAALVISMTARPAAQRATLSADLLKDWSAQRETMARIADAMPEEKFSFRATPPQRTYGEQILHVAGANILLMGFLGGKTAAPPISISDRSTFGLKATSKAEIVKALADSFDYGDAVLKEFGDAALTEPIKGPPFIGEATRARMAYFAIGHIQDIYGQMVVYLRLNGIVPPASRRGGV